MQLPKQLIQRRQPLPTGSQILSQICHILAFSRKPVASLDQSYLALHNTVLQMAELNKLTAPDLQYPYNMVMMIQDGRNKQPAYV